MPIPILSSLYNRRNLYILGLIIAFAVTFLEFTRGRHMNFIVFADATRDFWQGISPYTEDFITRHDRFFLYTPVFTVLFTPFAMLPSWLGPFAWNLFNYTLFFAAVFSLPERFSHRQKCNIFLFLLPILGELRRLYPDKRLHLIVVNDGSLRNFGEAEHAALLREIPDTEIVDIPHAGKGAAIRAGIARSKAPCTIYTDIDIPYLQESMREVIDRVISGVDVVIAVRNSSYHSKLSPMRKLMSYGSKTLNRIFLNTRHTDTQGGLKGLSQRARQIMLRTRINDFLFDTEFVMLASRDKRLSIEEIETTLRDGIVMSKMPVRVLFRELKNFFRIAIRLS